MRGQNLNVISARQMEEPHSPQGGRQRGLQGQTGAAPLVHHVSTRPHTSDLHTCTHLCLHRPAHACMHPQPHTHVHTCTHLYLHLYIHLHTPVQTCMQLHTHLHTPVPTHTCSCTHIHACTCICTYICTCLYTPTSAHTRLHQWPPHSHALPPKPTGTQWGASEPTQEPPFPIIRMTKLELKILIGLNLFRSISNNNTNNRLFHL